MIEQQVEEMLPPEGYKPNYLTSSIPFSKILEAQKAAGRIGGTGTGTDGRGGISTGSGAEASATGMAPLAVEIRNVDDSRYPDVVELRAFVYDTAGRFVMGLAPPHFAGTGNYRNYWRTLVDSCSGQAVNIDSFDVVEVREDRREPIALGFVLDHSGSMGENRVRILRESVARTLRIIKRGDQVTVLTFTNQVHNEMPLTGDTSVFRRKFEPSDLSTYGGGTSLYDGALEAIKEVAKSPSGFRRAIILFSDGADGNSDSTIEAVHRAARQNRVTIYTLVYGQADEETMRSLASSTGGRMYRIYSTREYPYVFTDIYRRMNNYYRITYRAPECRGIHTATASLSIPELGENGMLAKGTYDRSLFTPFDAIGQVALVALEFDYDKATLRPESFPRIAEVAEVMKTYPKMKLEIRGHTDDQGSDEYNLKLSRQRAEAVADALVEMGIERRRLSVEGFGESRPIVPNTDDESRKRNRRTEFVITAR
jgi:VWFA-related protein